MPLSTKPTRTSRAKTMASRKAAVFSKSNQKGKQQDHPFISSSSSTLSVHSDAEFAEDTKSVPPLATSTLITKLGKDDTKRSATKKPDARIIAASIKSRSQKAGGAKGPLQQYNDSKAKSSSQRRAPRKPTKTSVWSEKTCMNSTKPLLLEFLRQAGEDITDPEIANSSMKGLIPRVQKHQLKYMKESGRIQKTKQGPAQANEPEKEKAQHSKNQDCGTTSDELSIKKDRRGKEARNKLGAKGSAPSVPIANSQEAATTSRKRSRSVGTDKDGEGDDPTSQDVETSGYKSTCKRLRISNEIEDVSSSGIQDQNEDSEEAHASVVYARHALKAMQRSALQYMRVRRRDEEDSDMSDGDEHNDEEIAKPFDTHFYRYSVITDHADEPVVSVKAQQVLDGVIRQLPYLQERFRLDADRRHMSKALQLDLLDFKRECKFVAKELSKLIRTRDKEERARGLVNEIIIQGLEGEVLCI